jgi:hypothetical protein
MASVKDNDYGTIAYSLRNCVRHAVLSRDASLVRSILRSRFFELKQRSPDSIGLVSDVDDLLCSIASFLSPEDAPLVWLQWLRFGRVRPDIGPMLLNATRGIYPDRVQMQAIVQPDVRARLRYALITCFNGSPQRDLLPGVGDNSLDEFDLGGIVASLIADASRGRFESAETSELPGFDSILAWELAARQPSASPDARRHLRRVAFEISEERQGDSSLRYLHWLATADRASRYLHLRDVTELLNDFRSDALLVDILRTVDDLLIDLDVPVIDAYALADAVEAAAKRCRRLSAVKQALAWASCIVKSLGRSQNADALLSAAIETNSPGDQRILEQDDIALLLASARLAPVPRKEAPVFSPRKSTPATQVVSAAILVIRGDEARGRQILANAAQGVRSASEDALLPLLDVIGELLTRRIAGDLGVDLELLHRSAVSELSDPELRVVHQAKLLGVISGIDEEIISAFRQIEDPRSRLSLLERLAAMPCRNLKMVMSHLAAETFSYSKQAESEEEVARLARIVLLTGGPQSLLLRLRSASGSTKATRSVAAAQMVNDYGAASDWVGPLVDRRLVPTRTLLAIFAHLPKNALIDQLMRFIPQLPVVSGDAGGVAEALALLFRHRPVTEPTIQQALGNILEPETALPIEARLRCEAQQAEVLACADSREAALQAVNRVFQSCRLEPAAALRNHRDLLYRVPSFVAEHWINRMTHELLNRPPDIRRAVMNAVTSNMLALQLPAAKVNAQLLFLGSANLSPVGGRRLAISWLARCGHQHGLRITVDGVEDSLLAMCRAFTSSSLPELNIEAEASMYLAMAAENFVACSEGLVAKQLLEHSLELLPRSLQRDRAPFRIADAWTALSRRFPNDAVTFWPKLEEALGRHTEGGEALLLLEMRSGRCGWGNAVGALSEATLTELSRRASIADEPASREEFAALLKANLGHEQLADLICASLILRGTDLHFDTELALLKPLLNN